MLHTTHAFMPLAGLTAKRLHGPGGIGTSVSTARKMPLHQMASVWSLISMGVPWQLGVPFPIALEAPHVINMDAQVWARAICQGADGRPLIVRASMPCAGVSPADVSCLDVAAQALEPLPLL